MASFLGLGLFDPDEADEPTSAGMFSDNLDDYTFDSIETRASVGASSSSIAAPIPIREVCCVFPQKPRLAEISSTIVE